MTEDPKYNNGFTAKDIERYYSGNMSSLEMHQLEKAAMEDPFLADALEGYSHTGTPTEDMAYLHAQLQPKIDKGRVVPFISFNKNQFLRIAALFILLAGCGWAVYQFGFNQTSNQVALKRPEMTVPSRATDSNNNEAALQQSTTDTQKNAEVNTDATIENSVTKQTTTTHDDGRGTISMSTQNRHTGKLNKDLISNKKENARQGEQFMKPAQATIPSGSVQDEASSLSRSVSADKNNKESDSGFIASAPQSDSQPIMIRGYGTQRKQTVTAGTENVIVLQRSKSDPVPEVVLGKAAKRDSNYRRPHITFEEAEPEKGTAYYDDYVAQNLQMPEQEAQKNISGVVKLSFDINDAGEAVNITVEKSLCTECDKEAIRLLQQGPKWKKKKDKKGKLSIQF